MASLSSCSLSNCLTLPNLVLEPLLIQSFFGGLKLLLGSVSISSFCSLHGIIKWSSKIVLIHVASSVFSHIIIDLTHSLIKITVLDPCSSHISLKMINLLNLFLNFGNIIKIKFICINWFLSI